MKQSRSLLIVSFVGAFAGALSMADSFGDIRTYLKAFVIGLGATGLLRARLPGVQGEGNE